MLIGAEKKWRRGSGLSLFMFPIDLGSLICDRSGFGQTGFYGAVAFGDNFKVKINDVKVIVSLDA